MRNLLFLGLIVCAHGLVHADPLPATGVVSPSDDQAQRDLIEQGGKLLAARQPAEAIRCCFDVVIAHYQGQSRKYTRTYSSRSSDETKIYMLEAASAKTNAIAVGASFAYAHYFKSYALTELRQFEAAEDELKKALELSPQNAQFLAERGSQLARARAWDASLETFRLAETAAKLASPEAVKARELGRALRGQGFALVELHRFTEAEKVYLECLVVDPNDRAAAAELVYVRALISKNGR